ncbi:hypothetical protein M422DRAFT_37135, partial [Sphaerobolus stellatus SS14]
LGPAMVHHILFLHTSFPIAPSSQHNYSAHLPSTHPTGRCSSIASTTLSTRDTY